MSLIIDAIKKAQQLHLKELRERPFFREHAPTGEKGKPGRKTLILFSIAGLGILLILLLLFWGDVFLSLLISSQDNRTSFTENGRSSLQPEREIHSRAFLEKGASTVQTGKSSSNAFFIDVKGEGRLPEQNSKQKKDSENLIAGLARRKSTSLHAAGSKEAERGSPQMRLPIESKDQTFLENQETRKIEIPTEGMEKEENLPASASDQRSHPKGEVPFNLVSTDGDCKKGRTSSSEALTQFNLGVELHRKGEILKAIEAYEKVLHLDPSYIEASNNLGLIYQEIGDFDKAFQIYQRAIEINPRYEKTWNNLGILLLLRERYEESSQALQKALTINPNNIESHMNLGILSVKRGQIDKAMACYQKALTLNPRHGETHYNIALLYEQLGQIDLAIAHYQTFIRLSSKTLPDLASNVQRRLNYLVKTERK